MSWTKINDTLTKYHRNRQLHAAYICSVAQQVLGDEAKVVSLRDGTLTLAVSSSAQAANIQIQASQILGLINQSLRTSSVRRLRFKIT